MLPVLTSDCWPPCPSLPHARTEDSPPWHATGILISPPPCQFFFLPSSFLSHSRRYEVVSEILLIYISLLNIISSLIIVNMFPCTCQPSVYFLRRNIYSSPLPIFNGLFIRLVFLLIKFLPIILALLFLTCETFVGFIISTTRYPRFCNWSLSILASLAFMTLALHTFDLVNKYTMVQIKGWEGSVALCCWLRRPYKEWKNH